MDIKQATDSLAREFRSLIEDHKYVWGFSIFDRAHEEFNRECLGHIAAAALENTLEHFEDEEETDLIQSEQ